MCKTPKQSYTEELKLEAVKLVETGQRPGAVSRQLGIKEQTLANWRKAAKAGKLCVRLSGSAPVFCLMEAGGGRQNRLSDAQLLTAETKGAYGLPQVFREL